MQVATGSGKTTTIYTILKEIDSKALNITTLEDPESFKLH
nr:ATPase, T2SS/T4P/T4SS family [Clostridium beijerinckii]